MKLSALAECDHPLTTHAQTFIVNSPYAARQCTIIAALLSEDTCIEDLTEENYHILVAAISRDLSFADFGRSLRYFRHRHLLRLALREYAGWATIRETMLGWSACADAIIMHSLLYCQQQQSLKHGLPRHAHDGAIATLYTLAMGKLGGRELNFSSDIDVIFAFSASGMTDGVVPITNDAFFSKVIQQWLQLLQSITQDGFVFRVDLRLRPFGESGPLVYALQAMETYYQEQGRDWERYAMVKARVIGEEYIPWFSELIEPFVYRRYVDFSVIESLRNMKAMIAREIQLNPMLDDIKRGKGGIREVEFVLQSEQLVRGGRLLRIRQHNALAAFAALREERLLPKHDSLRDAYLFLRRLENALQIHSDQQTHRLPIDQLHQTHIACLMRVSGWETLLAILHTSQRVINEAFQAMLSKPDAYEDGKSTLIYQCMSIWQGHVETQMAIHLLEAWHFQNADRCYQMIHAFRLSPRCRRLSDIARRRLDRFMIYLISELTVFVREDTSNTTVDIVLLHVIRLLEAIVGRSAYLALLTENSGALQTLLYWFARSTWMTSLVVSQPFLLEKFIDQPLLTKLPSKGQLMASLRTQLQSVTTAEQRNEVFRQYKLAFWLFAARAECSGQYNAVRIGRFLADLSEVILLEVFHYACVELQAHYPDIDELRARFTLLAYGKLGSREMNYDSDVDLVFLHDVPIDKEPVITRLAQKILRMLTVRTQAGILYCVDTRLRPSGEAGLLVSHVDAFETYQRERAWVWEHQALLRARLIFGRSSIRRRWCALKKEIIRFPRERMYIANEIETMREKMLKHLPQDAIKQPTGGLIDVEFFTQFLILVHAVADLAHCTHTLVQLQRLFDNGYLSHEHYNALCRAYRYYHRMLHRQLLEEGSVNASTLMRHQHAVSLVIVANKS